MPALPIPYDHGTAAVLTEACLVLASDGIFNHPYCLNLDQMVYLTPAEFRACNWRRVVMARYHGMYNLHSHSVERSIRIRLSVYGVDLSERLRNVSTVFVSFVPFANWAIFDRLIVPRMAWLGTYRLLVERRLALAMANHKRLGANCLLQRILSQCDIVQLLLLVY